MDMLTGDEIAQAGLAYHQTHARRSTPSRMGCLSTAACPVAIRATR